MPEVEIIGVHPLEPTEKLFKEAFELKYGGIDLGHRERMEAEQHVRDELSQVVLVEVLVRDRDDTLSIDDFGQSEGESVGAEGQVAYMEVLLSDDGARALSEPFDSIRFSDLASPHARLVFFLHYFDSTRPVLTSCGPKMPPALTPTPKRLAKIIRYEPVD